MKKEADIVSIAEQISDVEAVNSWESYNTLLDSYLEFNEFWKLSLLAEIQQRKIISSPDYFKYLSIFVLLCAQYGYESFEGHIDYVLQTGNERPVGNPVDLLVTGKHLGRINQQARSIKLEMLPELEEHAENSIAIWGMDLDFTNGQVIRPEIDAGLINSLRLRMSPTAWSPLPIVLPNPTLQEAFAALPLRSSEAKKMTYQDFERDIYPSLQPAVAAYCDLLPVFYDNRRSYEPPPFYSLSRR